MSFRIGDFEIGTGRVFIIAEIGNNHNGCLKLAKNMIDAAVEAGADCVKFQMRHLNEVYRSKTLNKVSDDLGTEYTVDLLQRFELPVEAHTELSLYCQRLGVLYLCTPWDYRSAEVLASLGVPAFKIASADLTNTPLLKALTSFKKPLIMSTGMSQQEEIEDAAGFLKSQGSDFIILHCNSTYPAPVQDINLKYINELKKLHSLVGYSGHERGINISLAAIAMDICLIERHFTLDRLMEGPDHAASLEPSEFKCLVSGIREIELSLGVAGPRALSQGEMINREGLAKSLVATKDLSPGHIILRSDVAVKSPGQGISPRRLDELLGKKLSRSVEKDDFFFEEDLLEIRVKPSNYSFARPWGIPVRYHDFSALSEMVTPDLFEFHLSYSDMELNPNEFIDKTYEQQLVVHAPEMFEKGFLLDLATADKDYREKSIALLQRVVDVTRELNFFFPQTLKPLIVTNIGGFSMDEKIPSSGLEEFYVRFGESLQAIDEDGVEIIPQTMAPYPWHFGGQRFQNLFLSSSDIVKWTNLLDLRVCLDTSHSYLYCKSIDYDFYQFVEEIGRHVAYLHLADAKGLNGEGLQVGEGEIDFHRLSKALSQSCREIGFIPEIWQGHKNSGSGFWQALSKLEAEF